MQNNPRKQQFFNSVVIAFIIFVTHLVGLQNHASAAIEVQYVQLANGLKILLHPDNRAPTVACRIFYTTGSVHEAPGRTGIAHMLEHMLFKGSNKVGVTDSSADAKLMNSIDSVRSIMKLTSDKAKQAKLKLVADSLLNEERKLFIKDELWETYLKEGGTGLNAFTSQLMTAYFVTLPKNKTELFFWLESDRMQNAVLREFYPERDVVMEERRMRIDDRPTGRYWESLMGVFYEAHPYRFPTIGYPSDIANLSRQQAQEHYKNYYKPNNCILVLAGDFDSKKALEQIKRYFAGIPRGSEFEEIVTEEPEQVGQKRLLVQKASAPARIDMLFHTPGVMHQDLYALDILEGVLSGKSGRLYTRLVKQEKIATGADASNDVDKYTSTFGINVSLGAEPKPEKVEKLVWNVIDSLKTGLISSRELQRVKNQVLANSMRSLKDLEHLATELAFWEMYGGWNLINEFPKQVQQVKAEQVREVCQRYLQMKLSTVGVLVPEEKVAQENAMPANLDKAKPGFPAASGKKK